MSDSMTAILLMVLTQIIVLALVNKLFKSCRIPLSKTDFSLSTRAILLLEIQLLLERQDKYLIYSN